MLLSKLLTMGFLLAEAGGGNGGGAAAGAGAPGQAAPGPAAAPAAPAGQPGDKPVTRAELDALISKIDKLAQPPAPPPAPPQPPKPDDRPDWAKAIDAKLDGLIDQSKAEKLAGRKQSLIDTALAGIPESNKALAKLALEGMVATTGVKIDDPNIDVAKLAEQLAATLRSQHASLFSTPGSKLSAIPKTGEGKYDFSGVNSMDEVPVELIRHIPNDVYERLRNGGSSTGMHPNGGMMPTSRFHN